MKLSSQILFTLAAVVLAVGMAAGEFVRVSEHSRLNVEIEERTNLLSSLLSSLTIEAMIIEDVPVIETAIVEAGKLMPSLVEIVVFNESEKEIAKWPEEISVPADEELLTYLKNVSYEGETFGQLRMRWSTKDNNLRIDQAVSQARTYAGGVLVLLTVLYYLMTSVLVLKPLLAVHKQMVETANRDEVKNALPKWSSSEFNALSKSVGTLSNVLHEREQREKELVTARHVAETAEKAKSEFLANMSHEIRTPMNGVMSMAELLASTELNSKQKMFTDIIVKSGASLLTIINDILDFSKVDAGQMELDNAEFHLAEAVEDVATLVSSKAAEKDLELIVRVDPDLPKMIIGDVGRIRQIITNLLGNAVRFTEHGHVYVNIDGQTISDENGQSCKLKFSIEDTGIGIPQEKLDTVFDKFSQVDTSATRKHEGTGLGLSIASSLVKLMEGNIGVNSTIGVGSTFWFEIILPTSENQEKQSYVPFDVSGSKILIINDNQVNRSILCEQMTSWKFDNAAVSSGSEGIFFLKTAASQGVRIDCLILDYHMPKMNGGDVVKAIRADSTLSSIPIIMLTSVDITEDGKNFSSLGIQRHLSKPTRSSLLLETIVDVLQENKFKLQNGQEAVLTQNIQTSPIVKNKPEIVINSPKQVMIFESDNSELDVLVAEDNEVNQIVFKQVLQGAGYRYIIAENGLKAVELYKKYKPKIILMDVSMPIMNGQEATGEIRKLEQTSGKHTPIIGVTAHAIKGDMEKCFDAGMDDYLSKPVSPAKLEEKIIAWISKDEISDSANVSSV